MMEDFAGSLKKTGVRLMLSIKKHESGLRTEGVWKHSFPEKPLISVVTVVYNGAVSLEQTIQSVLNQTYDNIEYIIVDGGSTDGTLDIIKRYEKRIDYCISERDEGIYDAMNKGISLASGDLIGLLNADDFYELDSIKAVVDTYLSDRKECIVYGRICILQKDVNIRYSFYAHCDFWKGLCHSHPGMFVHKDVYKNIGQYDQRYRVASDYDFILRALSNNVPFKPIDKNIVYFRNSGLSFTNLYLGLNETRTIIKRYYGFYSLTHLKHLLVYGKSVMLIVLQKIIRALFGEKILCKARYFYTKKVISKGKEC